MQLSKLAKKLLIGLTSSGNAWLRDYEVQMIKSFLASQNEESKKKIISQLERFDLVQRSDDGKIVQFFEGLDQYRKKWPKEIYVDLNGKDEFKTKLEIEANDQRVIANLFLTKGALLCIEFKMRPATFQDKYARIDEIAWA